VRCFNDADEQIELWGMYLAEELPAIYGEQAAAVVMFVSAEYAAREWTRLERRTALARAVRERREYVLPPGLMTRLGPGHPCGEVAVPLASELFGNSVRHSGSGLPGETVTVAVTDGVGVVRIEVTDRSGSWCPRGRPADRDAEGGRELRLVAS
jgi:hypothetical protein